MGRMARAIASDGGGQEVHLRHVGQAHRYHAELTLQCRSPFVSSYSPGQRRRWAIRYAVLKRETDEKLDQFYTGHSRILVIRRI